MKAKSTKLFTRVAAIVVRDGFVLAHERSDEHGVIHHALPGGKLEADETAPACLIRELDEEFGLAITIGPLRFVGEGFWHGRKRRRHEIVLYFAADLIDPQAEPHSRETGLGMCWLPLDGGLDRLLPAWLCDELPRSEADGWTAPVKYVLLSTE